MTDKFNENLKKARQNALDNEHLEYSQKAVSAFQQTFQVE